MTKIVELKPFATALFFSFLCLPVTAQQTIGSTAKIGLQTISISDRYTDDEGNDILNPPLAAKYAHGLKHLEGNGLRAKLPAGPVDPKARERYFTAQDLRDIGFAYLAYHRYDKSIARLNLSRDLWPDSAATYRWLAEAYEANGQAKEGIVNYRLLFYGWPGKYVPTGNNDPAKPKEIPSDKPSDYDQPNPEESDPTLLMRFSLLLQETDQTAEAKLVYERGMQMLAAKFGANGEPLPPLTTASLTAPGALEAATRTALAIDQISYQDRSEAKENLRQALVLQSDSSSAAFHQTKMLKQ